MTRPRQIVRAKLLRRGGGPRSRASHSRVGAFTLLELLLAIVIVAILAALLLPVLGKAKGRGKQIECLNQLRQVGLAAQSYAHEHGDRFPFQTPVKDGGTLELVQAASGLGGDVQFAFRHFQALSNDLNDPKLLVCPADTRLPTVGFPSLLNDHISFFIATTAQYSQPDSVLSGDRNIIVVGGGNAGPILRISSGTEVAWTGAGHEYKGNLLFAGGHVERTTKMGLQTAMQSPSGPVSAWAPVASSSGSASGGPPSPGNPGSSAGSGGTGGSSGGRGGPSAGGSSAGGFAALQSFFQSPQNPGGSTPAESPSTPPARALVAVPAANAAPPPAPVEAPAPPKMPAANQPAAVAAIAPASSPAQSTSEPDAAGPAPGLLVIFVEPERCWTCWVVFLVISLATALTLGVLIQRRHQRRRQQAGLPGSPPVPPA